jgi:transposase-like protein
MRWSARPRQWCSRKDTTHGGADSGISKSEVRRICADLDGEVAAFRDRPLAGQSFPYIFVDATDCEARVNRRVVSRRWWWPLGSAATAAVKSSACRR